MKINLSVPALSTDPVEFVQINPGTLASDLAALPHDDFLYSGHHILNDLEQFNRASVNDELRLKLLDLYRISILNLAKRLRKSIGKDDLPISKKLLTRQKITLDLHRQLTDGYKRILLNQDLAENVDNSENIVIVSCERAVFSLLEILTLSSLSYTPVPENTWKEMHTIFQMAHQKGFTGIRIPDVADSNKSIKILDIYLFALLLGLSEPYGLPNGGLHTLLRYFHLWIGYLSLFDKNNLDGLRYFYRIDPDIDKPALPFPEAHLKGLLYVTTDSLVHQIRGPNPPIDITEDYKNGRISSLSIRSFFPKLISSWTKYPIRRYQRSNASGEIELITGLSKINYFLQQSNSSLTKKDKNKFQIWQIKNDSATGLGIEYHGHEVKSVNVGDMVLYRTIDLEIESRWVTGIICRFNQPGRSHLSIGIQRMPPDVHPGKIFKLSKNEKDSRPILMYPENRLLNSEATLATLPGIYHAGMKFHVSLDNGREFRIRAIKAVQLNPLFEQFTFESLDQED
ncbi:hypothetical protein BMS3Bbin11_00349 [bacterium BMS3Bbin11]|nr:hypothetical protein BMS3Abin11_00548 [bacterium BMS3Abin11]GBE45268.1 hypothetical protein BMS3Bbin11_00349 [bacterium BMS3Bbin11]HDL02038.1 hypothetical protein [candidate division Zixibacteria bacterium]